MADGDEPRFRVTDETHHWRPGDNGRILRGPTTIFVADVDDLTDLGDVADPGSPWTMVYPTVPDFPPADA